ncbi:hypothetical protein FA13DRAFT_991010 [Coprinellus micaceus]|uniref:Uncharacterized protein n=1 Tax=Coprinellus micaceus TaxID=71717 RepID=A0A4Y7RRW9_COPMI|nr:hypothetical protein FA13DRAFT_991010 [Coprinellus micaceus]
MKPGVRECLTSALYLSYPKAICWHMYTYGCTPVACLVHPPWPLPPPLARSIVEELVRGFNYGVNPSFTMEVPSLAERLSRSCFPQCRRPRHGEGAMVTLVFPHWAHWVSLLVPACIFSVFFFLGCSVRCRVAAQGGCFPSGFSFH